MISSENSIEDLITLTSCPSKSVRSVVFAHIKKIKKIKKRP